MKKPEVLSQTLQFPSGNRAARLPCQACSTSLSDGLFETLSPAQQLEYYVRSNVTMKRELDSIMKTTYSISGRTNTRESATSKSCTGVVRVRKPHHSRPNPPLLDNQSRAGGCTAGTGPERNRFFLQSLFGARPLGTTAWQGTAERVGYCSS